MGSGGFKIFIGLLLAIVLFIITVYTDILYRETIFFVVGYIAATFVWGLLDILFKEE